MRPLLRPALAFLALVPAALGAQSNAERMTNDAYTRSHDYDLVHQQIEVWAFNWDSTSFRGRVATTLVSLRPGLDSVILDAGHLLTIERAADGGGRVLRHETAGDTL